MVSLARAITRTDPPSLRGTQRYFCRVDQKRLRQRYNELFLNLIDFTTISPTRNLSLWNVRAQATRGAQLLVGESLERRCDQRGVPKSDII